ncbi:hypothetical protein PGT21_030583 [Puccinia graminis f. sp. tritici]|uniref:Uncharacterized protein n=1 Tax=Puccinia graminis f. sp. tritici TaxID=56615 RepID=A0A5B0Q456_PUCGR|nr:hypothetical protein PGT21_030583 [Puccinia graminis f. sp. tritici]KAA1107986.1 hypothetical protein PGTUg99_020540 [Puccinia graminis f. sp. tritici]
MCNLFRSRRTIALVCPHSYAVFLAVTKGAKGSQSTIMDTGKQDVVMCEVLIRKVA